MSTTTTASERPLGSERPQVKKLTGYDREQWIRECQHNNKSKRASTWNGTTRYDFQAFIKPAPELVIAGNKSDELRSQATTALAASMYGAGRKIPYVFYQMLSSKIYAQTFRRNNTRVLIKGSNVYHYYVDKMDTNETMSDMDLVIYINPNLSYHTWQQIKQDVHVITLDTMSRYKHAMDGMFCYNNPMHDRFLSHEEIVEVKNTYSENLSKIIVPGGRILSPFSSDTVRNSVSRNSFVVTESKAWPDHNVKVDVPHFFMCDQLFLPRTPIYLSHNCTIRFKKDEIIGDFDLFRIKVNNQKAFDNSSAWETVSSDFIDISVPNINDTGLNVFWKNAKTMNVLDSATGMWVEIPDIETYTSDLEKMLVCYDCPESKREKRSKRLDVLKSIIGRDKFSAGKGEFNTGADIDGKGEPDAVKGESYADKVKGKSDVDKVEPDAVKGESDADNDES